MFPGVRHQAVTSRSMQTQWKKQAGRTQLFEQVTTWQQLGPDRVPSAEARVQLSARWHD